MTPKGRLIAVIGSGAVAHLANGLGLVAIIWSVVQISDTAASVGILAAVALAVLIVSSLFGGWLVDRFGARRIALIGCALSAVPIGALATASTFGAMTFPFILLAVALAQLPNGATSAAFESRLPELAEEAGLRLETVNSADDLIDGLAAIAGAPIAGLLITQFDVATALWTAFALGFSAAFAGALALPAQAAPAKMPSVFGGLIYIATHRSLTLLLVFAAILVAAFQTFEDVVLPVIIESAGLGADSLGFVMGTAGAGGLIGSIVFMWLSGTRARRALLPTALLCIIAGLAVLASTDGWIVLLSCSFVAGIGAGIASPLINTKIQQAAPPEVRGRVLGASTAAALGLAPFTAVLSGYGIDMVGTSGVLFAFAACVGVLLLLSKKVR